MDLQKINRQASRYIFDRSCPSGGFCFYRLDEPNPQDTYFALASLDLLQIPYSDEQTIRYLHAIQKTDGAYESLTQTFFILLSLRHLGSQPLRDPIKGIALLTNQLLSFADAPDAARRSFLHELYQLAVLYEAVKLNWKEKQRESLTRLLHSYQQHDSGFGIESSNLLETFFAAAVLRRIGRPLASVSIESFLRSCEHPVFGFTGKPKTSLCFLEYLHAGLALCDEISLLPTYKQACFSFLCQCQTNSGGFARTHLAIATLENTYFAIRGLQILSRMMNLG